MSAPVNLLPHLEARDALEAAARASLRAPSVFNTQPWVWRISGHVMELSADPTRRLAVTDAEGRLLLISCGAALHHARVALAAAGWSADVERLPDARKPDLLARIQLTGYPGPDPTAATLAEAIIRRRTDRRAYGDRRVPPAALARLAELAEAEGSQLHEVPDERVPELSVAVDEAADVEYFSPAFRSELTRWTHRPAWTGDGIPPSTVVRPAMRRVPSRNFLPGGTPGLTAGPGGDEAASYVILAGTDDHPLHLLRGGEALSAVLLQATAEGIATAPISEAVEVPWPRRLLRRLLAADADPYLIVRLGYPDSGEAPPPSPRRETRETIRILS
ncbi:nitroreductase [Actinoplanes tereljensis]|uniref:NAD(P)H nitroreductase n=1 Tax=Paractinoplanes tereljensis TaxID=571912 RepID=A0A919NM20_9ACTN|nr:nitroreductase [Actinoplanes tereljensis]GIF20610.1 putative NAD(P)H nitroreductase [Actinoplanes tereljensis]